MRRRHERVSAKWWEYVRRVGDEIGVKPFDLTVGPAELEELIAEELTDTRLDELIQHMGRAFKPEMTRRSSFTSELFPMLPYMTMAVIDDFHTYAQRVSIIDAAMPGEQLGARLRNAPAQISPLWIWMVGYHFLCGRECLIKMGRLRHDERIDEIRTVVDFWRRLTLAHRGDGTLDNKDAGFTNRYLPQHVVEGMADQAISLNGTTAKVLKRLNATVSGYAFLYFTDSRVGMYDSGPYPYQDGKRVIVRDFLSLGQSVFGYPWADGLEVSYAALTLVLIFDPGRFASFEINDWGTTFSEPQLLTAVTEAAVYGHTPDGRIEIVDPSAWPDITTQVSKAHIALYTRFAGMNRQERIFSATSMYTRGLRPFAAYAGVLDEIDWSISPETMALYPDPLDDDAKAAEIFGTALVANGMPGAFSPLR